MSDILAKMKAVHTARKMIAVEVPEYDTTWHFPPLTVADRAACRKNVKPGDDEELFVNSIIRMAHDAEGNRVFKDDGATRAVLYEMDMGVLKRILEEAEPEEADTAKND